MEGSITAGFYDQNLDDVGYILEASKRVTARKVAGPQLIYDAVYTTGPDHFRVVPPAAHAARCVLLFGDSFTFGEGISDNETSAAQIVAKSEGTVAAKNFGIPGWGPHQFLAGLQSGRFQRAVSCKATDAVYLLIPAQIQRTTGGNEWDTHGPLFHLDAKGRPVRSGKFDNMTFKWGRHFGFNDKSEAEQNELAAALIEQGGRELRKQYPGLRFHVLIWAGVPEEVKRRLDARPMEEWLPDYTFDAYQFPIDGHPNSRAHERIAEYILSLPH
jgi:hypothetical protein